MQPRQRIHTPRNNQSTAIRPGKTTRHEWHPQKARHRPDVPGWFYTSTADEVFYYFLVILSTTAELRPLYSEYSNLVRTGRPTEELEAKLLGALKVDRDLLITYRLDQARAWYENASTGAFAGFAPASNPTYVTISRGAHRDRFIREVPAKSHLSDFASLRILQFSARRAAIVD